MQDSSAYDLQSQRQPSIHTASPGKNVLNLLFFLGKWQNKDVYWASFEAGGLQKCRQVMSFIDPA